jgi:hypothetical protein
LNNSSRWREQQHSGWWEVGITIDLKTKRWIVECALKSQNRSFVDFVEKYIFWKISNFDSVCFLNRIYLKTKRDWFYFKIFVLK